MKVFEGERDVAGRCRVYVSDALHPTKRVRLQHRTGQRSHSPSGFDWGFAGPGPAELARAIVADVMGEEPEPWLYQGFKQRVVQRLQGAVWSLSEADVRQVLTVLSLEHAGVVQGNHDGAAD